MSSLDKLMSAFEPGSLTRDDMDAVRLAKGRLDWSPKKNWVEQEGGLPRYIEDIAVELVKKGMTRERAIATAISRVKVLAIKSKDPAVKAKAAKAVAEWEKMKASAKARLSSSGDSNVLLLTDSTPSYPVHIVEDAFSENQRVFRLAYRAKNPFTLEGDVPTLHMLEQWNDHIIAGDGYDARGSLYKIPYTVADGRTVKFGEPEKVFRTYISAGEVEKEQPIEVPF